MKQFLATAALCALLTSPAVADWPVADMNRTIDQTNFQVDDNCSGTLIDLNGRKVLTAAHCLKDHTGPVTVTQFIYDGSQSIESLVYTAEVVKADDDHDLALLKIKAPIPNTIAAKLACVAPIRGEKIYLVGNPAMSYGSVEIGIVASTQRDYAGIDFGVESQARLPLFQISAGLVPGNSGGAVYNDSGEFVGVPVITLTKHDVVGFAVPLDNIATFLKANGVDTGCK